MTEITSMPLPAAEEELAVRTNEEAPSGQELIRQTDEDLATFVELLDSITTIDKRLKLLWKQIYEFALVDRRNAYLVWTDLYLQVHGNPEQHVIHGDHLHRYMEIMHKANTSLLKLAELVHRAKERAETDEVPTSSELFKKIKSTMR